MRRTLAALTTALLAAPLTAVPASAVPAADGAAPAALTAVPDTNGGAHPGLIRRARCVDGPLRLTANRPLTLGTSGTIQVHRADGSVADEIDLADPRSYQRTIGDAVSNSGAPHLFTYRPVIVSGNTAQITLHHELAYGTAYYVTVDPQVFPGFAGIRDPRTWRFRTRPAAPPAGTRHLTVAADGTGDFCTVQGAIDFVPEGYPYSQVTFIRTAMDAHIRPDGWQLNNAGCDEAPDIRFWEYGSTDLSGEPLDTNARLSCSRRLTAAEAAWWSDPAHVLGGWSPR